MSKGRRQRRLQIRRTLAEKLQGVGKNIDGTLRDVTVVSLSDANEWEADAYAAADASASRTPLTPERSES